MPLITSTDSFGTAKPTRGGGGFNLKPIIAVLAVLAVVLLGVFAFLNRDTLLSRMPDLPFSGGEEAAEHTEPVEETPPTSEQLPEPVANTGPKTGTELYDDILTTYQMPIVHTTGTAPAAGSRIDFDTTWTTDRQTGSGTLTYNGKTADTKLVRELLIINNSDDILTDLIGKTVPFRGWVLINSADALHTAYPDTYLLEPLKEKPEATSNGADYVTDDYTLTYNEARDTVTHVQTPAGEWSISPADANAIEMPGEGFDVEGQLEKDDDGQWRVYKLYDK